MKYLFVTLIAFNTFCSGYSQSNTPFPYPTDANLGLGTTSPISQFHTTGTVTVGSGSNANTFGVLQLRADGASTVKNRLTFGTDGQLNSFGIGKNQGGTVTDLLRLRDDGRWSFLNVYGAATLYYDEYYDAVMVPNQLRAFQALISYCDVYQLRGKDYFYTTISMNQPGITYNAQWDYNLTTTAHKFTVSTPFSATGSNIATFDNGGSPLVTIDKSGNILASAKIAIGTTDMTQIGTYSLAVNGNAIFNKVKVKSYGGWADYVFHKDYKLPKLEEIESFIKANGHLPEMPTTADVEKDGIDLAENQTLLLKKVEELTLILIDQNKKIEEQSKQIAELQKGLK